MFAGKFFYHSHIRKAIIAFGTIFNNLVVQRKNSEGQFAQSLRVPLAYSTKQKFLARIASVTTTDPASTAITLPRIGFEITGLNYNPTRKINILTKNVAVGTGEPMIACFGTSFITTIGAYNHQSQVDRKPINNYSIKTTIACFAVHSISKILLAMRVASNLSLQRKSPCLQTTCLTGLA